MDANLCTKMFIAEFLSVMKIAIDIRRMSIWWNTRKTFKIVSVNNLNYIKNNYETQISKKKAVCQIIGTISSLPICVEEILEGKNLNVIGVCFWEMELLSSSFIVSFHTL